MLMSKQAFIETGKCTLSLRIKQIASINSYFEFLCFEIQIKVDDESIIFRVVLMKMTMEQHTLKNVNKCLNANIYSYLETSGVVRVPIYI
jgi:hypothetical protein